jgi:hypothetical protein
MIRAGLILAAAGAVALVLLLAARFSNAPLAPGTAIRDAGVVIAAAALLSGGFALAIFAALREGFGALDRFFQAALARSTPAPQAVVNRPAGPVRSIVRHGTIAGRPYALFSDGSAEVETLLGQRCFESLADALDFVAP